MLAGIGRRGRAALCGGALAGAALTLCAPGLPAGPHGGAVFALLGLEAVICGAAAGAATAGHFGREGAGGAARALWGGVAAAALGLVLFGAGAGLWLKTETGAPVLGLADLARAFGPLALAAALLLQGVERLVLRVSAPRDAESL